ncbi:hypothetical protein L4D76_01645 [Photobacterium sagamiensis]|uniref:hypothetical protein n=1 Tax=Photobacterium sagamiensis TaxID=2910241 RepID=UPI003D14D381
MRITAERFIDCAWILDLRIISADSSLMDHRFIDEASKLAKAKEIDVQYLDFSRYNSAEEALTSHDNADFRNAIEDGTKPRLLWFYNCDSLAPLSCALTYSLRSVLTTRLTNNVQSVFIAKKTSLNLIFNNHDAAFYQSNFSITEHQ